MEPVGPYTEVDMLLELAAKKHKLPSDLLKGTAWKESDWEHWDSSGKPKKGKTKEQQLPDWGIMQVSELELRRRRTNEGKAVDEIDEEVERVKNDMLYNIELGSKWVSDEYERAKIYRRRGDIENDDGVIKGTYSGFNAGGKRILRFKKEKDERDIGFWKIYQEKPWNTAIDLERKYWRR